MIKILTIKIRINGDINLIKQAKIIYKFHVVKKKSINIPL